MMVLSLLPAGNRSKIPCALTPANSYLRLSTGPLVKHYCQGITISTHPLLVQNSFKGRERVVNKQWMCGNDKSMTIMLD